ncbi:IclR family transcriptional regulator [Tsukamurella pulmonis]|uniref:DNA-binding transcriptional regulator, IclR family n=1 Tax=Tsukamurella pulmonis TaxID=47312 RepID=A0A1H1GD73_9ACTN|nr:IclR family transcriptional regulator [Tsukamurella pulmonis]KXO88450.1 IclR family transcriptional regulator [Tsukamurella pulmonis]KXP13473.1 IclR family transcriptional regulator [Tsukamurella pulmonis]RDH11338.1 IclR family transcriptional regulator [Tsukamurella pulmonis]SDR11160.1 DNA-binding transcriptional regulator, IclR family [Tsukamurella pulmonis]SUP17433.1 Acetate operon repressor [Tsukamurella pulmonis]
MGKDTALPDAPESLTPVSGIGVLDKSVAVLRAAAAEPASLADLCGRTGLPRATAHRLAVGLELHGLLTRDGDGLWRPGSALRELAASTADALVDTAAMVLPRLREITGESVQLYRREGDHRICVAAAEPPSGLRDTVPVGSRLPMTAGSGAKVLAAWADTRADSFFTDRALSEVRKRGWAQSAGERESGVASVSAPVRNPRGEVIAAISVSGPIDRMGRRPGARWAADLLQAAEALQRRI